MHVCWELFILFLFATSDIALAQKMNPTKMKGAHRLFTARNFPRSGNKKREGTQKHTRRDT